MSNTILNDYQRVLDRRRADRAYLAQVARGKHLALLADWKQGQTQPTVHNDANNVTRVLTKEQFYGD